LVHPGGGELGGKPRLAHARRRKRPVTEPLGQRHCRAEGKYCNHFMSAARQRLHDTPAGRFSGYQSDTH
jgi:hypothetical protein